MQYSHIGIDYIWLKLEKVVVLAIESAVRRAMNMAMGPHSSFISSSSHGIPSAFISAYSPFVRILLFIRLWPSPFNSLMPVLRLVLTALNGTAKTTTYSISFLSGIVQLDGMVNQFLRRTIFPCAFRTSSCVCVLCIVATNKTNTRSR